MTIRTRLSIQFSLIVITILSLFSIAIYFSSSDYRESEFRGRLNDIASSTARLLHDVEEINVELLRLIGKNSTPLYEESTIAYSQAYHLIYSSQENPDSINIPIKLIDKIFKEKVYYYSIDRKEYCGLVYGEGEKSFVIIASALDKYGYSKLKNLRIILIIALFTSVLIASYIGWIYSGQALKPMSDVVREVDLITVNNLYSRVNEGNGQDEIALLAITFNKMLGRVENAFKMQRSFVSNASHELRTPLTSIRGEIEVTLLKKRSIDEYEAILNSILEEMIGLSKMSNGLLDLAQASTDIASITKQKIRIDDLIWQVRSDLLKRKKDYSVNIFFDEHLDDEKKLTIDANEQLLRTAFLNLMDNACKYSDNQQVDIYLGFNFNSIKIDFVDKGIGISEEELKNIFEPFYRAENARAVKGHGIGLPLVDKIIRIHNGDLKITSNLNKGTTFSIQFPFSKL